MSKIDAEITYDIPPPISNSTGRKYPFDKLKPGGSFVVQLAPSDIDRFDALGISQTNPVKSFRQYAVNRGWTIAFASEGMNKVRLWRVT